MAQAESKNMKLIAQDTLVGFGGMGEGMCMQVAGETSYCRDGILDELNGEECDDGNSNNYDACSNVCTVREPLLCDLNCPETYTCLWYVDWRTQLGVSARTAGNAPIQQENPSFWSFLDPCGDVRSKVADPDSIWELTQPDGLPRMTCLICSDP